MSASSPAYGSPQPICAVSFQSILQPITQKKRGDRVIPRVHADMDAKVSKIQWLDGDETEDWSNGDQHYDCAVVTGKGSFHVSMSIDERTVAAYACPGCSPELKQAVKPLFTPNPVSGDMPWGKVRNAKQGAQLIANLLKKT